MTTMTTTMPMATIVRTTQHDNLQYNTVNDRKHLNMDTRFRSRVDGATANQIMMPDTIVMIVVIVVIVVSGVIDSIDLVIVIIIIINIIIIIIRIRMYLEPTTYSLTAIALNTELKELMTNHATLP